MWFCLKFVYILATPLSSVLHYVITPSSLSRSELRCRTWQLHQVSLSKRKNMTVMQKITATCITLRSRNINLGCCSETDERTRKFMRSLCFQYYSIASTKTRGAVRLCSVKTPFSLFLDTTTESAYKTATVTT